MRLDELSSDSASDPVRWPLADIELAVGDAAVGDEPVELAAHDVERLVDPLGRGAAVDRERARLLERAAVREHRVRQAALLADLLEEPRAHPAAEHLVDDREREAVGVVAPERAGAEHDVRLLERALDAGEPVGVGGVGATGAGRPRAPVGRLRVGRRASTTSSWSRLPAAATTTFDGW